jgi:hypothetical protein
LISEIGKGRLTVGKIYGGLLILENWKATKFGKVVPHDGQVTLKPWKSRSRTRMLKKKRANFFQLVSTLFCALKRGFVEPYIYVPM